MDLNQLEKILPIDIIKYNTYMKDYSTFGIGGKVLAYLEPRTVDELCKCVKVVKKLKIKYQVIGNASNILFKSGFSKRVIITTRNLQRVFRLNNNQLTVSSGTFISELIMWCIENGLSGLEELYGIPATVGGMVMMNAGAFEKQIFDKLIKIEVLDNNKIKTILSSEIKHSHHYTELLKTNKIILSVTFKLERLAPSVVKSKCREVVLKRQEKQPKEMSAGSVFRPTKDGEPAGLLIDKAGLKGLTIGGAKVSEKHANFIINNGNATDEDIKTLIKIIKQKIKEKYHVNLKREIEYIGDRDEYYR